MKLSQLECKFLVKDGFIKRETGAGTQNNCSQG